MAMISKFGNVPVTCPIVKGNYFIKDYLKKRASSIYCVLYFGMKTQKKM
jgi:hypothetical protein